MKMIKIIVRPESTEKVVEDLAQAGFVSLTKIQASGRGKQKGLDVGSIHYDELPKTILILVVEDSSTEKVLSVVKESAWTGNYGDGKVFVIPVEDIMTVRTGLRGL